MTGTYLKKKSGFSVGAGFQLLEYLNVPVAWNAALILCPHLCFEIASISLFISRSYERSHTVNFLFGVGIVCIGFLGRGSCSWNNFGRKFDANGSGLCRAATHAPDSSGAKSLLGSNRLPLRFGFDFDRD